jgi:hypothetical protein
MPGYGNYRTGVVDGTDPSPGKIPGAFNNGSKKTFVERFDLSKANVLKNIGQNNLVANIPAGHAILSIKVSSTVSLTTSTLAFGTAASAALYGTAKVYGTTADVVLEYLLTSKRGELLTAGTDVLMTAAAANLPGAGIIVVEIETVTTG